MIDAHPLHWPQQWPRHPKRITSIFGVSFARARDELLAEIQRLGGRATIISTNLALRNDGLPYANLPEPDDPGVAVYFTYNDTPMVFACDRYLKVKDNMRAIGKTIEALRGIERWGASDMMNKAFTGFQALPGPGAEDPWYVVLDLPPDAPEGLVRKQYRILRSQYHPDRPGGSGTMFRRLVKAYQQYTESRTK